MILRGLPYKGFTYRDNLPSTLTRHFSFVFPRCCNLTLREYEDETHTLKVEIWESFGTLEILKFNCKGQNTSHWGVLYIIGKLAKCRCRKWACMSHLDICNTNYGKKKGRESNWQFDSRPLKVGNRPDLGACRWSATHRWTVLKESYKFASDLIPIESLAKSYDHAKSWESKPRQFRDSSLGVLEQKAIRMWVLRKGTEYTIWGKVVASPSPSHGDSSESRVAQGLS